ncbi:type II 3-dehydroquinate dehydratase [soil metagenome]
MAPQLETVKIGIVHGPNLNLLGSREPEVYGTTTLAELDQALEQLAGEMGCEVVAYQANAEGALIDHVQHLAPEVDGFVVNAGALTHTSIALRDALTGVAKPFVEVHISNVFARESFRHHSYLSDRAVGLVAGFGVESYLLGLRALITHLRDPERPVI